LGCIDTTKRNTFVTILPFSSIGRPWQSQPGTKDTYDTEVAAYRKKKHKQSCDYENKKPTATVI
jgi:hypothetical protein